MSRPAVTVVNYGLGNLFSVVRALEVHTRESVLVTDSARDIVDANRLILPGVGAFAEGMNGLTQRGLVPALRHFASSGRPLLGICLGMQLLFERSHEFGMNEGLGLIKGDVVPVRPSPGLKVPHIGWTRVTPSGNADWAGTPLATTPEGSFFYFVHSFHAAPNDPKTKLAECSYGGQQLTALVGSKNVFGSQFHPEKSGAAGLELLRAFLAL